MKTITRPLRSDDAYREAEYAALLALPRIAAALERQAVQAAR